MHIGSLAAALAALTAIGCVRYERRDTSESRSVELGAAKDVRVQVEMGAGELRIGGGAVKLFDADFHYNVAEWRPQLKYDVSGSHGYLSLRQPPARGLSVGNQDNRWDLRLNDQVPVELKVNLGAGEGTLRLSGMKLHRLEVGIGAGELKIDLRGPWDDNLDGSIRGGVGEATIQLPREAGVRVRASGGIGGINAQGLHKEGDYYTNDAYGKSGVRVRLDVQGGIGQINLIG
jgi:hypothetical protein